MKTEKNVGFWMLISNLSMKLTFILCSAEEDIYEDAEEDEFEYYEVGAGDAPYILSAGITFIIKQNISIDINFR